MAGFPILVLIADLLLAPGNPQAAQPPPEPGTRAANSATVQLWDAAILGNLAGVREALRAGATVNAPSDSGPNALALAALYGHPAVVDELVAAGADVKIPDSSGMTPLMLAAGQGHTAVVEALSAHGADVNAKDRDDISALMMAASASRLDTI